MLGLVADIGGTNARFALVEPSSSGTSHKVVPDLCLLTDTIRVYPVAEFETIQQATATYLDDVAGAVESAVIAVAAPVLADEVVISNSASQWQFSQTGLKSACGFSSLTVINDFAALAYALPGLSDADFCVLGSSRSHREAQETVPELRDTPLVVIGPGTGLGVSALLPSPPGQQSRVIQGEGGHSLLRVTNEREYQLFNLLARRSSSSAGSYVSAEHMLSGAGIEMTYRLLHEIDGKQFDDLSAARIVNAAKDRSDTFATETLNLFCRQLGYCAGDTALLFGARQGVFIGGGIVPKMSELFVASGFRDAFNNRGLMQDYMQAIPTQLITAPFAALQGAATLLRL